LPGCFWKDRSCLPEVATKEESDATEESGIVPDVLKSTVQGLKDMAMLHRCFIINDDICLPEDICKIPILLYSAGGSSVDRDRDFESGMGSMTIIQKKGCYSRGCDCESNTMVGTNL
jgi:hypothetical protein